MLDAEVSAPPSRPVIVRWPVEKMLVAAAGGCVGVVYVGAMSYATGLVPVGTGPLLVVFFAVLAVAAAVDGATRRLPNRLTGATSVVCGLAIVVTAAAGAGSWVGLAMGMGYWILACGGGWLVTGGRAIGGGDVKLAPTVGAVLGFIAPAMALVALVAAFLIAGCWGLIRRRHSSTPFAPCVLAAVILAVPLGGWLESVYAVGFIG